MKKTSFDDYIKGDRRGMNAHDLERMSQSDPFLADAIDGFDTVAGNHLENIEDMRRLVNNRVSSRKYLLTSSMYWKAMAVCVVLVFLIGGGYLVMLDERNSNRSYSTASANTESIEIYIPQEYLDKKDALIMDGKGLSINPVENIENMEVFDMERELLIYLPKDHNRKGELRNN